MQSSVILLQYKGVTQRERMKVIRLSMSASQSIVGDLLSINYIQTNPKS